MRRSIKNKFNGVALVIVDSQKLYADPKEGYGTPRTRRIAKKIAAFAEEFRKGGGKIYSVSWNSSSGARKDIDFYGFVPDESKGDRIITKSTWSAFESSDIDKLLKEDNIKTLLACGFNKHACVQATSMDAKAFGYDVNLLSDLCGIWIKSSDRAVKSRQAGREMQKAGIRITNAAEARAGKIKAVLN